MRRRRAFTAMVVVSVAAAAMLLASEAVRAQQSPPSKPRARVQSPHGNLAIRCENCHTFTAWKPIRNIPEFDHNKTKFPLRGMHAGVTCMQCHTKLVFSDVGTKCSSCHADIHRGQFGAACESCHTVNGWRVSINAIREHNNRFPLVGAHAVAQCEDCHKGAATGQFQGLSTDCYSCHAKEYQTAAIDHRALGFPTSCNMCHTMDSWFGAKFDHARFTGFALTGTHATLDCVACHAGGRYKGTPANCIGCHRNDFNGTTNPNHVQAGFPSDCAVCHTTAAWQPAKFDHNTFTKFPLTGMHAGLACTQCHVNGQYAGTPADCASCHINDYNKTTNPNHKTAGFPTDCSICHATSGWSPATFDHSKTGFPLTGAHASLACVACHVNNNFTSQSAVCSTCHLKDYNATTNPNHKAAGFPTDCTICHSTTAWSPSTFNHSNTPFPLTGAHTSVACTSCHVNNVYAGTPTDCYSCHKQAYQTTTNPNHVAAQFPTTCNTCHNTATWIGAVFNHTWFPIYSGAHAGQWTTCGDCHVNPSNYAAFSCITCHTHDRSNTDPHHSGVSGYVYSATSCYTCHANGQAGD